MSGFSGSTGVTTKQMNDAISQSTASKANRHVYTTSGSFNSASVSSYVNNVLETIRTGIANYSNGVLDISSGTGPRFGVVFYKLNATYWSAMLMTYATSVEAQYYAKYENGTCVVIAID